jgi:hypothetical protein
MNENQEHFDGENEEKATRNSNENISIGIDIGTSRSAISASNGKKYWVESFVGWPKDFVAREDQRDRRRAIRILQGQQDGHQAHRGRFCG